MDKVPLTNVSLLSKNHAFRKILAKFFKFESFCLS